MDLLSAILALSLPSLVATARSRLLTSDLTTSPVIDRSAPGFPPVSPADKEVRLAHDVHAQILDVENLNASRWEQIQDLEAVERGERTRGRRVVRVDDDDDDDRTSNDHHENRNTTHRLILQDSHANRLFAIELARIGIALGKTSIGEKMLVKAGAVIARGVLLLTPDTCLLLGGRIDAWHDAWAETRLARLRDGIDGYRLG